MASKYLLEGIMSWDTKWEGAWWETASADQRYPMSLLRQAEDMLSQAEAAAALPPPGEDSGLPDPKNVTIAFEGEARTLPRRSYWRGSFQYMAQPGTKPRIFSDQCLLEVLEAGSKGTSVAAGVYGAIGAVDNEVTAGTIRVLGRGRNQIGSYSLLGQFDLKSGILAVERIYDPKNHQQKFPPIKPRAKVLKPEEEGALAAAAAAAGGSSSGSDLLLETPGASSAAAGAGRRSSGRVIKTSHIQRRYGDLDDEGAEAGAGAAASSSSASGMVVDDEMDGAHEGLDDAGSVDTFGQTGGTKRRKSVSLADGCDGDGVGDAAARKKYRHRLSNSSADSSGGYGGITISAAAQQALAAVSGSSGSAGGGSMMMASDALPGHSMQGTHYKLKLTTSGGGAGAGGARTSSSSSSSSALGGRGQPTWHAAHAIGSSFSDDADDDTASSSDIGAGVDIYEGDMLGGLPHGHGTAVYRNGLMYEGGWSGGQEHGWGVLSDGDDVVLYQGDFYEGTLHGQGSFHFGNGDRYVGGWKEGLFHGVGTYTCAASGASYDGEWAEGQRHGQGVQQWGDGSLYNGGWRWGQRFGKGDFTSPGGVKYRGNWTNDAMDGKGEMAYPDGSRYEGSFHRGKRDGRGTYTFPDGQQLSGKWNSDHIEENACTLLMTRTAHLSPTEWMIPLQIGSNDVGKIHYRAGFSRMGK